MIWLIPVGYLAGMMVFVFAWSHHDGFDYEAYDWAMAACGSLIWPIWLLLALVIAPSWLAGKVRNRA